MTINRPEVNINDDPHPLGPLAGDYQDDDGRALDDYFESADHMPVKETGLPAAQVNDQKDLPIVDRTISRTLVLTPIDLTNGGQPIMFFAADLRRKFLKIVVVTDNAVISFGSQKADCYGGGYLYGPIRTPAVPAAPVIYDFPNYTGAVWIGAISGDAPISVSAYCITQ